LLSANIIEEQSTHDNSDNGGNEKSNGIVTRSEAPSTRRNPRRRSGSLDTNGEEAGDGESDTKTGNNNGSSSSNNNNNNNNGSSITTSAAKNKTEKIDSVERDVMNDLNALEESMEISVDDDKEEILEQFKADVAKYVSRLIDTRNTLWEKNQKDLEISIEKLEREKAELDRKAEEGLARQLQDYYLKKKQKLVVSLSS
jgi:hypothetical protein